MPNVSAHMMENDPFSQWLGIAVEECKPQYCKLSMTVREEMCNGFGIAHGGITYSMADSALAFAANQGGIQSMSIETSIHHLEMVKAGTKITAEATCIKETRKTGLYTIEITDESGNRVAWFKGTVYRTGKEWNI